MQKNELESEHHTVKFTNLDPFPTQNTYRGSNSFHDAHDKANGLCTQLVCLFLIGNGQNFKNQSERKSRPTLAAFRTKQTTTKINMTKLQYCPSFLSKSVASNLFIKKLVVIQVLPPECCPVCTSREMSISAQNLVAPKHHIPQSINIVNSVVGF